IAAVYRRPTSAWLWALVPAAAAWTTAMLSLSKGVFIAGLVGTTVTFLGCLVLSRSRLRKRVLATAGLWLALTGFVQIGNRYISQTPAAVDYISGKADPTRETSIARVFMWKVGTVMVRGHWLVGVGADNFGIEFNKARAEYRLTHAEDPPTEINSDFLVERAHNEPLQITAELGVIGLILFTLPFALAVWFSVRAIRRGWRPTMLFVATIGGMLAFAISSMVSSFSFRIVQNGIVFFMVFATAVREITRETRRQKARGEFSPKLPALAVTMFLALTLISMGLKAAAEYSFATADRESSFAAAAPLYHRATLLDPDYGAAWYRLGSRGCDAHDRDAAADLVRSFRAGMGVVLSYSSLADCYEKSGDLTAANEALDEALRIFPRSVFLRLRHSLLLQKEGRSDDAEAELDAARRIDLRQADGWYNLMTRGSVRAFYDARSDANIAPPADLTPQSAVLRYLDKPPGEEAK
ncbi:MAG TPA: O-antigen ligase family protein, partial [Pyrinomonadaceae bacterium]|nr:O-antigen ligase family protein [Pyrinomonadaceae bacterium]